MAGIKQFIKNPGGMFSSHPAARAFYKGLSEVTAHQRNSKKNAFFRLLSGIELEKRKKIADNAGYLLLRDEECRDWIPPASGLLEFCKRHVESKPNSKDKGKSYLRRTLEGKELLAHAEVREFLLSPPLLSTIGEYLGDLPILSSVKILHSLPTEKALEGSQFFHCDHDDFKQVKLFFYIKEVSEKNGPLTLIPSAASSEIRKKLGYKYGGYEGHVKDELMNDFIKRSPPIEITGAAGTLALADVTSCFHLGSRVAEGERWVFFAQFVTQTSYLVNPAHRNLPVLRKLQTHPYRGMLLDSLSELERLVLGN